MKRTTRFNAQQVRETLLARGGPVESGFIQYVYRPFDTRWLYWEAETDLIDRPRAEYKSHVFPGNMWIESRKLDAKDDYSRGTFTRCMGDNFGNGLSHFFPAYLRDDVLINVGSESEPSPNLSPAAQAYLGRIGAGVEDLFHHVLAVLHDPAYRESNAGALRMEWPRIPLPCWPEGSEDGVAKTLAESAARGREIGRLLDQEAAVTGVTVGVLRPEISAIAIPVTTDNRNMSGDDFYLDAGWGHFGAGQAVMPGQGSSTERDYASNERAALANATPTLGQTTFDIYLNDRAYWKNIPAAVWNYKLGGYQVLKKWLSYRERKVLGRLLTPEEVQHFSDTARRIAGLLLLTSGSPQ